LLAGIVSKGQSLAEFKLGVLEQEFLIACEANIASLSPVSIVDREWSSLIKAILAVRMAAELAIRVTPNPLPCSHFAFLEAG